MRKEERLNTELSTAQSVRSALGLPARYFLSLGRMVPKKNLATLVAAYGRYCDESRVDSDELGKAGGGGAAAAETCHTSLATPHSPLPALVFVGSGEEEAALMAQARELGLEVESVKRKEESGKERMGCAEDGIWKMEDVGSERGNAQAEHCNLNTDNSAGKSCGGGAVFFYGFRQIEENPVFYALAEAFVLPSLYEEWGLVVNEAMACGLPVIVSRAAGCAEDLLPASGQVTGDVWRVACGEAENCSGGVPAADEQETTDGGDPALAGQAAAATESLNAQPSTLNAPEGRSNGFLFDPKSVEQLAEALGRLAGDAELRRQMGAASREIVERFSCENFARQAVSAAHAALGDGR